MHNGLFRHRGGAVAVGTLALILAACGTASTAQPSASTCLTSDASDVAGAPCDAGGGGGSGAGEGPGAGSPGQPPATSEPTDSGLGSWTLTLVGGSKPGDYAGRDVMNCFYFEGGWSLGFRPTASVILLITVANNAITPLLITVVVDDEDDNPVDYATDPDKPPAVVLEGPTVTDGVLSVKVQGAGVLLTAVCPVTS